MQLSGRFCGSSRHQQPCGGVRFRPDGLRSDRVNETLSQIIKLQKVKKIPGKPELLFSAVFLITNGLDSSQPVLHQKS